MRRLICVSVFGWLIATWSTASLLAQQAAPALAVPRLIKFAGVLNDASGQPRTGVAGVTFSIYKDQQGGAPLWMETQNVSLDAQGGYSVLLGSTLNDGMPLDLFATGEPRWLAVQAQLPGEAEQPRILLVSVPYALKAADADTVGGLPASAFLLAELPDPSAADSASTRAFTSSRYQKQNAVTGGTGTTNRLTKWLDATGTLGDSGVFENGGKVGIGTTAPATALDVFDGTYHLQLSSGSNPTISAPNSLEFDVKANGQNIFRGLDAWTGTWSDAVTTTYFQSGRLSGNVAFSALFGTQINRLGFLTNKLQISNQTGSITPPVNYFQIDYSGSNLFSVQSGGNVGIGTTAPAQKLDVNGTAKMNTLMFADSTTMTTAAPSLAGSNTFTGLGSFTATPTGTGVNQGSLYVNPATAAAGQTVLGVAVGGTPKLLVDNAGNVTASGLVNSTGLAASSTGFPVSTPFGSATTVIGAINTAADSGLAFVGQTASTNAAAVVGMHTATSGSGGAGIAGIAMAGQSVAGVFENTDSGGGILAANASNDSNVLIAVGDGAGGNGRVAIGDENTGIAKFTIQATPPYSATGGITVTSGSNLASGTGTSFNHEVGAGDRITIGATGEVYTVSAVNNSAQLVLTSNVITSATSPFTVNGAYFRLDNANGVPGMVITNLGAGAVPELGIGTLVPSNLLDVAGRASFRNRVVISGGPAGQKPSMLTSRGSAFGTIGGTVQVTSGSTAVLGSGTLFLSNLGLGDRISIGGSGEVRTITSITNNNQLTVDSNFNTAESGVTLSSAPGLFRADVANGTPAFLVNDQGSVGIGTLLPGRELEVNGGVRLNTVTTQPACDATQRGTFWVKQGGTGEKDSVQVCAKDATDLYAWRTIF